MRGLEKGGKGSFLPAENPGATFPWPVKVGKADAVSGTQQTLSKRIEWESS